KGLTASEVVLGFLEEPKQWRLLPDQFPSKVGGRPAWLGQRALPSLPELECEMCRLPMAFLLQVYAPISGQERSFHRTLFVFCCKTHECYTFMFLSVFRSQLPRRNDFYSFHPPPEEEPIGDTAPDHSALPSGVKLCWVCGCPGNKACSRCHAVTYCGKHHQTLHWKHTHKKECSSSDATTVKTSPFLFPEFELVPEEHLFESKRNQPVLKFDFYFFSFPAALEETDLEEMAMHETEDNKVFQRFKKKTAPEPHQVVRYSRGGSPLWVSSQHVPSDKDIPPCTCGAARSFEFQVMPQLLNSLSVDATEGGVDWGTLAVYTCSGSCNQGDGYSPEFVWKQDFISEQ
uniref:Programmed cell death 2 n=1 Tax=Tetraodon nigroviridis TaxID=99883 RepID=H3DJY4_TETNG